MPETTVKQASKSAWRPTAESFGRFLAFLDNGTESNGASYIEMQRRLAGYFARKGCLAPEELADETLNRVSRRLDEEGSIEIDTPARYCYITARFVFLEHTRATGVSNAALDESRPLINRQVQLNASDAEELEKKEKMLRCLDECSSKLDEPKRGLIFGYYFGNEGVKIRNRSSMAERLGISLNALSIRACRIRRTLESCVRKCAGEGMK
jgi:DNA-directed RNA polymerase specialized sigma24 family protein